MRIDIARQKRRIKILAWVLGIAIILALAFTIAQRIERKSDTAPEGAGQALSRKTREEADAALNESDPYENNDEAEIASLYYNGQGYVYNENLTTLLIIGVDDPELVEYDTARNTAQADLLLLAVFDKTDKTCTILQLNRDTMSDVPALDKDGNYVGLVNEQLALAHTYGNGLEKSCENTVFAVSNLLYGIGIDNYFSLTMDAVPILNDLVGGVTVTIEDDFTGVDDTLVKGETVTLTAENVEHFVRARSGMQDDKTNLNRMKRQRTYMVGLVSALKKAINEKEGFVLEAYNAIDDSLVTDCTVNQLSDYADRFSDYTMNEIQTTEGKAEKGEKFMEFYVDEEALKDLVVKTFYTPVE